MRWSESFILTLRQEPKEAEAISHKLMLRSGIIRKLSSGIYIYPPLGFKVLKKVINIVREEMDRAGAQELLLPAIHPQQLWEETNRIDELGADIIKFQNRHGKEMVLAPTHEEVITWLIAREVKSYKQLPLILYQIQTKFRDEPRPRFGVIRTSEFIMKDAYSFDLDWQGLEKSYQKMLKAYCKILERCGLHYLLVEADPGVMGGDVSHEFMVPAASGEDKVVRCNSCEYLANYEIAARRMPPVSSHTDEKELELKEVPTPGKSSVDEIAELLNISAKRILKTILYNAEGNIIAVLVRGDHELSHAKLRRYLKTKDLKMASPEEIYHVTKAKVGFCGPVGLGNIRLIADYDVRGMHNFVTGANKDDYHLINVNLERDFHIDEYGDLRYVKEGDSCPRCGRRLKLETAIEIAHIFKLGTRYSEPLRAYFLDKDGKERPIIMGCYGIGINRIIAGYIEQHHDAKGIIWNESLSPFSAIIIATNMKNDRVKELAEHLYNVLKKKGIDVLFDNREISAGVKFNDADLTGIPKQIIVGEKSSSEGKVELRLRGERAAKLLSLEACVEQLSNAFINYSS